MQDAHVVIPGNARALVTELLLTLAERSEQLGQRSLTPAAKTSHSIEQTILSELALQITASPTEADLPRPRVDRNKRGESSISKNLKIRMQLDEYEHLRRLLGVDDIREVRLWSEITSAWDRSKRFPTPGSTDLDVLDEEEPEED